ncbi:hypothetical protein BH23VER1_BH23VER1_14670 [soil metagenome]
MIARTQLAIWAATFAIGFTARLLLAPDREPPVVATVPAAAEQSAVPQSVLALIDEPATTVRARQMVREIGEWAKSDPAAAGRWVEANLRDRLRDPALAAIAIAEAETDPLAPIRLAETYGWRIEFARALESSRVEYVSGASGGYSPEYSPFGRALVPAFEHLAQTEGAPAAIARLEKVPDTELQTKILEAVVGTWAGSDPSAVIDWLALAPPEDLRSQKVAEALFARWWETDPAAAMTAAELLPPSYWNGHLIGRTFGGAVKVFAKNDPEATVHWLATLQGAHRDHAATAIVSELGSHRPDLAAEAFLFTNPDSKSRPFLYGIMQGYAKVDIGRAITWLEALDPKFDAQEGYVGAGAKWTDRDPSAASSWVAALPAGANRDAAVHGMVSAIVRGEAPDLAGARAWAETIDDPERRTEIDKLIEKAAQK